MNNRNEIQEKLFFTIDSNLGCNPIRLFRTKGERTDVFLIGGSQSAKSALLTGILAAGIEKKKLLYNHTIIEGVDLNFRCFYQMLESKEKSTFCVSRNKHDINVLPCDIGNIGFFNRKRKLNFVETNGEYWQLLSQSMCNSDHNPKSFQQTKYLHNENRKILLFLVDYSKILEGYDFEQRTLLENLLMTLSHDGEDTDPTKNCTISKADAVMILFTKSDLMNTENRQRRKEIVAEHLNKDYLSFMRTLAETCKRYYINVTNGFKPYFSTFSIGKTTDGITYHFDSADSQKILNWIEEYSK